jgi:hypothetical protein
LKYIAIVLGLAAGLLWPAVGSARLVQKPDGNTLWLFDGKNVSMGTKPDQWRTGVEVKSVDNQGLIFSSAGEKAVSTGHYVPLDAAYPYMVMDISEVKNGEGYRGLTVFLSGVEESSRLAMVSYVQTGRFILRMYPKALTPPAQTFLAVYLYNTTMTVKTLKMVKQPTDNLEIVPPAGAKVVKPGDEVTFRVTLEKPAEDVTLTFYNSYTMPHVAINDQQRLQLKPEDDAQKIWSAKVKMNTLTAPGGQEGLDLPVGGLMVRTTILGGSFKEPLWTWNIVPFNFKKGAK